MHRLSPFGVGYDGAIAPMLGLTPTIDKLPWPLNAKELANHAAWTATAEVVHRRAGTSRA